MKNQTLYIDRFSLVSYFVVTSELQFLRLTPGGSNLRLCEVLESPRERGREYEGAEQGRANKVVLREG